MISLREGSYPEGGMFSKMLTCFKTCFPENFPLVYYPCSAHDPLAHQSFPDSRVIAVDMFAESIAELQKGGYEAYRCNVETFDIKQVAQRKADIILFLNPQFLPSEDFFERQLQVGGYCLCNNWSKTAGILRKNQSFQSLGVIRSKNDIAGLPDDESSEVFLSDCEAAVWETIEKSTGPFFPFGDYLFVFKKVS